jgi:hypothetical protein
MSETGMTDFELWLSQQPAEAVRVFAGYLEEERAAVIADWDTIRDNARRTEELMAEITRKLRIVKQIVNEEDL